MKLVNAKEMTAQQEKALHLCLVRSRTQFTRDEVLRVLAHQLNSMEAGTQFIDKEFPIPEVGETAMIARDNKGCPLLINLSSVLDAKLLSNFLCQADWIVENMEILNHFYSGQGFNGNVRLWCLVEEVLPEASALLKHLDSALRLEVFSYCCLDLSGEKWLVIQRVREEAGNKRQETREKINHVSRLMPQAPDITQEEIDDFFSNDENIQTDFDADIDEVTYVGPYSG